MARPKIEIDEDHLEKLAEKQWGVHEIAAFFHVSHDVIERRYASKIIEARARGRAKLIDIMWQRGVIEKSDRVLIHLLERVLGPIPREVRITREQAIEFLETDAKRLGLTPHSDIEALCLAPAATDKPEEPI